MKTVKFIILFLLFVNAYSYADSIVVVTANETIGALPAETSAMFGLTFPWWPFADKSLPEFPITETPTTQSLNYRDTHGNQFNIPTLLVIFMSGENQGLTWYYYCDGLTFHYDKINPSATITFSGNLSPDPGGDVICHCTGNACSTGSVRAVLRLN